MFALTSLHRSGHYDPDAVRSCAQTVALHWQTLMLRIEDRLKLVNASAAFYRTSQQVTLTSHTFKRWKRIRSIDTVYLITVSLL